MMKEPNTFDNQLHSAGAEGVGLLAEHSRFKEALSLISESECRDAGGTWCSADPSADCEHNIARKALGLSISKSTSV
jgi:hypothetical protein